jgi:hypothetical protein
MSMHRKNKCKRGRYATNKEYQPWFWPSVRRRRMRNKMAKLSRRANR